MKKFFSALVIHVLMSEDREETLKRKLSKIKDELNEIADKKQKLQDEYEELKEAKRRSEMLCKCINGCICYEKCTGCKKWFEREHMHSKYYCGGRTDYYCHLCYKLDPGESSY